jgi:predicted ester cyclase
LSPVDQFTFVTARSKITLFSAERGVVFSSNFKPISTMTTIEQNKQLARRWMALIDEGKVDEICEMITPNWTMHGGKPGLAPGPAGMRELFGSFGPIEQKWTIEDIIAEGDKVVVRATNSCLQDSFFGIPSRGRRQLFTAMFTHWMVDGKIAETWRNADDLGRVLQLGAKLVAPAPANEPHNH